MLVTSIFLLLPQCFLPLQKQIQFSVPPINIFPNELCFLRVCSRSLLKTLCEKEKMLVTSIFLLLPQCFLPLQKQIQFSVPPINPFPNEPRFLCVCSRSLLKTLWEKENLLVTSNFSFSQQCFLPFWRIFCHFHQS